MPQRVRESFTPYNGCRMQSRGKPTLTKRTRIPSEQTRARCNSSVGAAIHDKEKGEGNVLLSTNCTPHYISYNRLPYSTSVVSFEKRKAMHFGFVRHLGSWYSSRRGPLITALPKKSFRSRDNFQIYRALRLIGCSFCQKQLRGSNG